MTVPETIEQACASLDAAVEEFCAGFHSGRVTPILDADVAACLYHQIVVGGCPIIMVYLATRVCGAAVRTPKPGGAVKSLPVG